MDLRSTYNKIAKDWMKDHHGDTWWINGTDTYLSFLELGASILDIGCGSGEKAKYLVQKGFHVTGIDFSEEMIALAKAQVPTSTFLVKDIKKPLGLKRAFDGVFAQAVLLHMPKKEVAHVLRNITAPLMSGGHLYVAVKEIGSDHQEEKVVKENDYGYEYERFFSYFTLEELKKLVTDLGMEVVYENQTSSGETHWVQVMARRRNHAHPPAAPAAMMARSSGPVSVVRRGSGGA